MDIAHRQAGQKHSWRPSPLTAATLLLHLLALGAMLALPDTWPYALGVIAANHLVLAVCGLTTGNSLLGPNMTRLPPTAAARGELALTLDDGPDPQVTPLVLDLLDRHGVKANFFCVGDKALLHPDLCREIARRGHAVENHGQAHSHYFAIFGPKRMAIEIDCGQRTLSALTGAAPQFFRPTAGLRNAFLDPVLARRDLRLVNWTRRGFDTVEGRAEVVFLRLARNLSAGDILLLHDGNSARTEAGVPVVLEVLPRLLESIHDAGLHPVTLRAAMR